jgi:hypothetical protein
VIVLIERISCVMLKKTDITSCSGNVHLPPPHTHIWMERYYLLVMHLSTVNLPDFIGNVHFQCINFTWFVTEQPLLKVAPQKINQEGLSQVVVAATDPQTSVNALRNSRSSPWSLLTCGMLHHLARTNLESVIQQVCTRNTLLQCVWHTIQLLYQSDRHTGR